MEALENAAALLRREGAEVQVHPEASPPVLKEQGIHLILANHSRWMDFVNRSPKAVIANLGYLPGSDHDIVTQIPTTIAALTAALEGLSAGGRLAVVCYVEHPGGRAEAEAVERLFSGYGMGHLRILRIGNLLSSKAPFLLVVEKKA
jgi:hypothetical protein